MATSAISGVSPQTQSALGLDFQSLLKIIMTELTYQDPLKPLDNFQFVSQLAEFSQLQQSQTLNEQVTNLLSAQSAMQATSLLGKTVDLASQTAGAAGQSGVVQAISFASGAPQLTIRTTDGQVVSSLSLSDVVQVR